MTDTDIIIERMESAITHIETTLSEMKDTLEAAARFILETGVPSDEIIDRIDKVLERVKTSA